MDMDEKEFGLPQEPSPEAAYTEPPVPESPAGQARIPEPPVIEQPRIPEPPVTAQASIPQPPAAEQNAVPEQPIEQSAFPAQPAEQSAVPEQPAEQPVPARPAEQSVFPESAAPAAEQLAAQSSGEEAASAPEREEPTVYGYSQPTQSGSYVSGTYRFGPSAFAQTRQSAARAAEPDYDADWRGLGCGSVRSTVQPAYTQAAPVTPPPAAPERKEKKKRRGVWLALALVLTLALGGALGALGYKQLSKPAETPQQNTPAKPSLSQTPAPTQGKADIADRITRGDSREYTAPAEIYKNNVDAVVGISNESTTTNIWGQVSSLASSGTGFIISEDGYILTNYHVAKGADKLTVTLNSGERYTAQLIGYDNITCDVALLKIEAEGLPFVKLGDSDTLQVGEQVCTIGNPLGELTYTLTVGYVSAKERAINTDGNPINMLQTDAAINSGNSGGPLFDMGGNVVGIVTAKYSGSSSSGASVEGIGFAIPISNVLSIMDDLQQYGYVTNRAYLGVMVANTTDLQDANLPAGAYISSVAPDSCAERADIRKGDVIVGMGDRVVNSYEALLTELNRYRAGETETVTLFREGSYLKTEVTFDRRPQNEQPVEQETQPTESPYSYSFGNPFGFWFP